MGTEVFGIKVSKKGFDVNTANLAQLAIDSRYSGIKQSSFRSGSVVVNAGTGSDSWNFGLSYAPLSLSFAEGVAGDHTRYLASTGVSLFPFGGATFNTLLGSTSGTATISVNPGDIFSPPTNGTYAYNAYIYLDPS